MKPIDLRQRFRGIVIKLVDREGAAIDAEIQVSHSRGSIFFPHRPSGVAQLPPGELPIIGDAWGIDLILSVEGYQRVRYGVRHPSTLLRDVGAAH